MAESEDPPTPPTGVVEDLKNNIVGFIFKKFGENSGIVFAASFIVLVLFFGNLIDYILVNQTDAAKSSIFIKYSVRWWTLLFCALLVLNLVFSRFFKPVSYV